MIITRSVHVVDFSRWQAAPNFATDGSGRINWGKWSSLCDKIMEIGKFQRSFNMLDTHDFINRNKVRRVLMEMPIMPEVVSQILHSFSCCTLC